MAKFPLLLLLLLLTTATATATATATTYGFVKSETDATKLLSRPEKLTHMVLYWHDVVAGRRPTTVIVGQANMTKSSPTFFGQLNVIDDPLTVGPAMASGVVGRSQGVYALSGQDAPALLMAMNFVFTEGKYNGSTITIMGRNQVLNAVREMPIIGGSGLFRFARGYVQARTHVFDAKSGNAVVKYDCYAIHY